MDDCELASRVCLNLKVINHNYLFGFEMRELGPFTNLVFFGTTDCQKIANNISKLKVLKKKTKNGSCRHYILALSFAGFWQEVVQFKSGTKTRNFERNFCKTLKQL